MEKLKLQIEIVLMICLLKISLQNPLPQRTFPNFYLTSALDEEMAKKWPNLRDRVTTRSEELHYIPVFNVTEYLKPNLYIQKIVDSFHANEKLRNSDQDKSKESNLDEISNDDDLSDSYLKNNEPNKTQTQPLVSKDQDAADKKTKLEQSYQDGGDAGESEVVPTETKLLADAMKALIKMHEEMRLIPQEIAALTPISNQDIKPEPQAKSALKESKSQKNLIDGILTNDSQ